MARIWACLVVVLCAGAAQVAAQCDCKTVPRCPQALRGGKVTPCIVSRGRGIGLCCPATAAASAPPPPPPPPPAAAAAPAAQSVQPAPEAPPAQPAQPSPVGLNGNARLPPRFGGLPGGFPGFPFLPRAPPPGAFPGVNAAGLPPPAPASGQQPIAVGAASQVSLSRTARQNDPAASNPNALTARSIPHNLHSGAFAFSGVKPPGVLPPPPPPVGKPPVLAFGSGPPSPVGNAGQKPPTFDFMRFLQLQGLIPKPPGANGPVGTNPVAGGASSQGSGSKAEILKQAQAASAAKSSTPVAAGAPKPVDPLPAGSKPVAGASPSAGSVVSPSTASNLGSKPAGAPTTGSEPAVKTPLGGNEVQTAAGVSPGGQPQPKAGPTSLSAPKPGFIPFGPFKHPGLVPPFGRFGAPRFPVFRNPQAPGQLGSAPGIRLPPRFALRPPGFGIKTPGLIFKAAGIGVTAPGIALKATPQAAATPAVKASSTPAGSAAGAPGGASPGSGAAGAGAAGLSSASAASGAAGAAPGGAGAPSSGAPAPGGLAATTGATTSASPNTQISGGPAATGGQPGVLGGAAYNGISALGSPAGGHATGTGAPASGGPGTAGGQLGATAGKPPVGPATATSAPASGSSGAAGGGTGATGGQLGATAGQPTGGLSATPGATTSGVAGAVGGPPGVPGGQATGVPAAGPGATTSGGSGVIGGQSGAAGSVVSSGANAPGGPTGGLATVPGAPARKLSTAGVQVSSLGGIINPGANALGRPTSASGAAPGVAPAIIGPNALGGQPGSAGGTVNTGANAAGSSTGGPAAASGTTATGGSGTLGGQATAVGGAASPGALSGSHTGGLGAGGAAGQVSGGGFKIGANALGRPAGGKYVPGQFVQPGAATRPGICVPLVMCTPLVAKPELLYSNWCRLRDGSPGTLCTYQGPKLPGVSIGLSPRSSVGTGLGSPLASMRPMNIHTTGSRDFRRATEEATPFFNDASLAAEEYVNQQEITAANIRSVGQGPLLNSPTTLFFWNAQANIDAQDIGLMALHSLSTVKNLEILSPGTVHVVKSTGPDGPAAAAEAAVAALMSGASPPPTPDQLPLLVPDCEPAQEIYCEESLYRTINGQCNNIDKPRLGSALTGFKRQLADTYDDGIFAMRTKTIRSGRLPSARMVSERVLDTLSNELRDWTLSLMQFGQFVAHDVSKAHVFRLSETEGIECCLSGGTVFPAPAVHPQCIPIPIKLTDPFYGQYGQRCMGMTRSLPTPESDCMARPAKQLNEHTHFLDGSQIYGSDPKVTEELRLYREGQLLTSEIGELLPMVGAPGQDMPCRAGICFLAGDTRVNQQSGIAVVHTIWMREHNRIARYLVKRHPDWSDNELFQAARRIVIAEWQHIVYNEYLPAIIGFDYADDHGLLPLQKGFSNYYDAEIDPAIATAFSSAAFRFGHSMVRDMYDLLDANGQVFRVVNLTTTFFEPTVVSDGFVGHARTLVARRSETVDTSVAKSIQEQLFTTNFLYGMDLLAIDIQRGRDHGAATYAQAAEACGVVQVHYWGDLHRVMESKTIDRLRSVYDDPRDVDLFVGGISERLAPGAQVGPTFQCLIAQQFYDLRFADRFFYDNGGLPHSFTEVQLGEIRKTSWARILCDTLGPDFHNDFTKVQPLAFLTTLGRNQVLSCNTLAIPHGELSAF